MQISISNVIGRAINLGSYASKLIKAFKARVLSYPNSIFEAEPCLDATLAELNAIGLLKDASLIITPNAYNEGILYDVVPNTTLDDMNVVRATTATRVNSAGLVEIVPYNLLTYSNTFSNGNWGKTSVNVTSGQSGYDGTLNAWLLASTTTPTAFLSQSITVNVNSLFSVYLKKGNLDWAMFLTSGTTFANFDLNNGVLGSLSNCTATIESVGNGWYKCTIKPNIAGVNVRIYPANGDNTRTITGNILIQNAQLEESTSAKEYFPTTTRLNIPRIDYTNGSCPSLLVEGQRTNLFLRSEQFTNASWIYSGGGVSVFTDNFSISPSGNTTASRWTAANINSQVRQNVATINTTGTISVWMRTNSGTKNVTLFINDIAVQSTVTVNTTWQRFTLTGATGGTLLGAGRCGFSNNSVLTTSDYIEVWGAQYELGAYATSLIPTVASTVTRNADLISNNNLISKGLIVNDYVLFLDITNPILGNQYILDSTDISSLRTGILRVDGTTASITDITGGISLSILNILTIGKGKMCVKRTGSTLSFFANGVKALSTTTTTVGTINNLKTGVTNSTTSSYINSVVLFPIALTDTECINLTTL